MSHQQTMKFVKRRSKARIRWLSLRVIVTVFLLLGPCLNSVASAPVDNVQLKAAYIHNFIKFIHWPGEPFRLKQEITVCTAGDVSLFRALREIPQESVRLVDFPGNIDGCDVLYLAELEMAKRTRLLSVLSQSSVLTISDIPEFINAGGMIGLQQIDGRLRFEINLDATRKAGLSVEARLLKLAANVLNQSDKN